MATILTKKSDTASAVPLAADLTNAAGGAELAVNATDKRLFSKTSGGTVVELGTNPSSLTLPNGTANGLAFLNASKVVTSGSALTFDGTALGVSGTANNALSVTSTATTTALKLDNTNANGWGSNLAIFTGGTAAGYFGTIGSLLGSTAQDLTVYATASNGFRVYTNGNNERMRVTSGGDVGIGTSSPAHKLQVAGNIASSGNGCLLALNSTSDGIYIVGGNKSYNAFSVGDYGMGSVGALKFASNNSINMTLDSSGNLGLGVTPSAWGTSGTVLKALQLGSGSNGGNFVAGGNGFSGSFIGANAYYNGTNWIYSATNGASYYNTSGNGHAWYNAPSGTAGDAITFTQAMTLDASGNLGIGATSSLKKLTVQGSTADRTVEVIDNGSNDAAIMLQLSGVQEFTLGVDRTDSSFKISDSGALGTNDRLVIDSSGNLLVGTTTAYAKFASKAASGQAAGWFGVATDGDAGIFFANASNTTVGSITVNSSTTAYNTSSDYRLKNTITPMTGALAKVALLKPCTYKWNVDGSDGEGFIAHELAEVVPQCVTGEKDAVDAEGNPKYQGIDTSFLVATVVAALQELKAEFDAYKASHP